MNEIFRPTLIAILFLTLHSPLLAQAAIQWRVSFNGALGAPTIVADGAPGDLDPAPGDITVVLGPMTNGTMTLAGGTTIIGAKIPGVDGRNIVVTAVGGSMNPGQFPAQAGTIDIYACYQFIGPGLEVGPPHVFTRGITGSFVNAVDGTIDFAQVRFNAGSNTACAVSPNDPGFFQAGVGPGAVAPIPFFHGMTFPLATVAAVDIGTATRLTVFHNGDGISLPGSVEASVVRPDTPGFGFCSGDGTLPTPCPCVPPNTVPNPSAAPGHGCANSFNLAGTLLTAYGTLNPDTLVLSAFIGTNYAGFGFLVKGSSQDSNGVANGDGLRCVDGSLIRFGSHYAGTNGASPGLWTYPNAVQQVPISVATLQGSGSARYQLIYRNAVANFCSSGTVNWSSGVIQIW